MPKEKQKQLLDAAAVLNNPDFSFSSEKKSIMPPSVFSELKDLRARLLADNALRNSLLILREPKKEFLAKAKESAKKLNTMLSKADFDVLSLAIELKEGKESFSVVTDDYSLQNVLSFLKIKFEPSLHKGINRHFVLKRKCRNCGKPLPKSFTKKAFCGKIPEGNSCDFCGNEN